MNPFLKVVSPGLHTTLQDLGRFGYQEIGIPVSGALDNLSLRIANRLVGNPPETAALEILHQGPTLAVMAESVRLALAGGQGAKLEIAGRMPSSLPAWQSVRLFEGEIFRVEGPDASACCYLAVEGGFAVAPYLGSRATFVRGRLGGFAGRPLAAGELLALAAGAAPPRVELRVARPPGAGLQQPLRVVLGPQQDYFTPEALAMFFAAEYIVSANADRMGLRLEGPRLAHRQGYDITSDAIATGAIQVPGHGQPIVLLADHPTTGGYPKIAAVISADLPVVGRRRPGDRVRFAPVEVGEAERIRREQETALRSLIEQLEPADRAAQLDAAALYRENLISGVVAGDDRDS